jgi:hypothetical protein
MSSLPTATSFAEEPEKYNQPSVSTRKARRRRFLIVFTSAFLIFVYLFSPYNTTANNPFAAIFSKVKTWTGCHTSNAMASSAHSASGWHTRATEHTGSFGPAKEKLVLNILVNSQVEHDGFTLGLIKPNFAVDARGKILILSDDDFAAFMTKVEEVKALPVPEQLGQWRVKQQRTSYPIDILKLPGQPDVSVYGWSASTSTLEGPTEGHTSLPDPLQTLVGWAKEAREGYQRGHVDPADQEVIDQVKNLLD